MAWYQAGPDDGPAVLLLHGEPSWSFLYRTVMAVLARAGLRSIAVDLAGFGRSDKPAEPPITATHGMWSGCGRSSSTRSALMRPAGSCYVCEGCGSTSGCS